LTINVPAGIVPKSTDVVPVNPLPVMVTIPPPEVDPVAGFSPVTTGVMAKRLLTDKRNNESKNLNKWDFITHILLGKDSNSIKIFFLHVAAINNKRE
jgi:hypothetical protein